MFKIDFIIYVYQIQTLIFYANHFSTIRKADNQTGDVILRVPSGKDTTSSHHHGHGGHHHHGLPIKDGHCVGASLRGLFVIIALSLHEVLEGLAVGLQNEQAGVLQLFAAVASHKFVISFCVGLELSTTGVTLLIHTIYILTFSLVTPLGNFNLTKFIILKLNLLNFVF